MAIPYIVKNKNTGKETPFFLGLICGGTPIASEKYTNIELSNQAIDALTMTKNIVNNTGEEILPNNNNLGITATVENNEVKYTTLTSEWQNDTEMIANFTNGDLNGGDVFEADEGIDRIYLRRSSNRTNFLEWEDICKFDITYAEFTDNFQRSYTDKLIESGIIYKYSYQPATENKRGWASEPVSAISDYTYSWLIGQDEEQFLLAFNPEITNYKSVRKENIVETIGSEFPYVFRNSELNYRQFNFSGTIASQIDIESHYINADKMFLSDTTEENAELSVLNKNIYEKFNKKNNFTDMNNYIKEREFRKHFETFLLDGKPKVFKSDTEGILLVRLTDVVLTPKNNLGRTIYDFSCVMTEIGKPTYDNLAKNGIKGSV